MTNAREGRQGLLRGALRANAGFSGICGLILLTAAAPIADTIGLANPWILRIIAVALVVFAGGLFRNAARAWIDRREAWTAVILDSGWVIASGVVILTGILNTTGNWTVAVVAEVVLLFAILQFVGLRIALRARRHA